MVATATPTKILELLEVGSLDEFLALPDSVVKHGDNVYLELCWEDQALLPEVLAIELEPRLRELGAIPADGQDRMVVPDPDNLRVWINYREQSPEFGMVMAVIGGLGLLGTGVTFFLFRQQVEQVLGAQTNMILGVIAIASALLLGLGIFMAMQEARQPSRLRS